MLLRNSGAAVILHFFLVFILFSTYILVPCLSRMDSMAGTGRGRSALLDEIFTAES